MPRAKATTCGHAGRNVAHGLCPKCYAVYWRNNNPEKDAEHRQRARARFHGIELEDFERILAEQGQCCGLCGKNLRDRRDRQIDHCHTTGRVRGVLCFTCNKGLGMLGDNESGLLRAVDYLRGHKFDTRYVGLLPGEAA
jgi:hypothetical protein